LGDGPVILWVGQPDGEYSFLALERLLRDFRDPKVSLLFRAHPRDSAYLAGRYNELLATSSLNVKDVSSYPDMIDLYHAADLVVTQFSSAAVEASYLGVPALYVLFDDLGRLNLEALKGYSSLPWWENESAFLVQREGQIAQVLTTALFDHEARARIRANFQSRFASRPSPVHAIADRVRELAAAPI
jgi:CDP-glycerol glycerophosphotransferase (TagB/SpsB family)